MSSAAGLSAAKRRRGASSSTTQQSSTKEKSQDKNVHVASKIPPNMPPLGHLLYVHEERLRRLEGMVSEDTSENSANTFLDRTEFVKVVQAINDELNKMKQMVSDLQSTVLSNASAIKSARENVKDSVVSDVTEELNSVSLTSEESSTDEQNNKVVSN